MKFSHSHIWFLTTPCNGSWYLPSSVEEILQKFSQPHLKITKFLCGKEGIRQEISARTKTCGSFHQEQIVNSCFPINILCLFFEIWFCFATQAGPKHLGSSYSSDLPSQGARTIGTCPYLTFRALLKLRRSSCKWGFNYVYTIKY